METEYYIFLRRSMVFFAVVAALFSAVLGYAAGEPAPVPKTGQITSYAVGDDGAVQKGLVLPSPRFSDIGDGTVVDLLTSLVWMKNANCWGLLAWTSALAQVVGLNSGIATCTGYTGGQSDWRLPSVRELASLTDYGKSFPALPTGHPFSGVQTDAYWSGSAPAGGAHAWSVYLGYGYVYYYAKSSSNYVWPVRGGQ